MWRNYILWLLCFSLFLVGCNETFEPLQENDEYFFSMYGYLDASADTQWVRVEQLKQSINESPVTSGIPDTSGIKVTLEHIQTGETVLMNDSLFTSSDFLNYWTTFDIETEQTYRIKADRADGKSSEVTVTTPKEIPTPIVYEAPPPPGYYIYIDEKVEHIADVQSKWYLLLNPETEKLRQTYTFTYKNNVEHTGAFGGAYFTFAPRIQELNRIENSIGGADYKILHRQFFVAAAGPEWDEDAISLGDLEYFLNNTASNVKNGLGYVVGIDSKWVPHKTCLTPDGTMFIPCPEEDPFWK